MSVGLRMLNAVGGTCLEVLLHFYSNVIEAKIYVRFEEYKRVKFEVLRFKNFKWLYHGMYLELRLQ